MKVDGQEFDAINVVYMNCDLEKDEFCKMWEKMNAKRIESYKLSESDRGRQIKHLTILYDFLKDERANDNVNCVSYDFLCSDLIREIDKAGIKEPLKLTYHELANNIRRYLKDYIF